jgi:hypothetical protein
MAAHPLAELADGLGLLAPQPIERPSFWEIRNGR